MHEMALIGSSDVLDGVYFMRLIRAYNNMMILCKCSQYIG